MQFIFVKQKKFNFINYKSWCRKTHNYQVGCIGKKSCIFYSRSFKHFPSTAFDPQTVMNRGIWIVGGVGSSILQLHKLICMILLGIKWYSSVTTISNSRSYTGEVALNNKNLCDWWNVIRCKWK